MDDKEKRMAGTFEITQSIHIGDREVVFGINEAPTNEDKYICSDYYSNELFGRYEQTFASDDYLEMMGVFIDRVSKQIEQVNDEISKVTVPIKTIEMEDCNPIADECFENQVIVIKTSVLRREFHRADKQVYLCTGGNGSMKNARGSACFCTNIYDGKTTRFERRDVLGILKPEHTPKWVTDKLAEIQKNRKNKDAR